jgi:hypothetical protein
VIETRPAAEGSIAAGLIFGGASLKVVPWYQASLERKPTMPYYRPRLTEQDIFDIRIALHTAVDAEIEAITRAVSMQEVHYHLDQVTTFAELYRRFRRLNGFDEAAELRIRRWTSESDKLVKEAVQRVL